MAYWRTFPTEIASDLSRFHQRHIREWHRGGLSSRELVDEILPYLPEISAYKTARRGGDWSDEQYIAAFTGLEVTLARGSEPEHDLFLSPMQKHIQSAVDAYRVKAHDEKLAQLQGKRKAG